MSRETIKSSDLKITGPDRSGRFFVVRIGTPDEPIGNTNGYTRSDLEDAIAATPAVILAAAFHGTRPSFLLNLSKDQLREALA